MIDGKDAKEKAPNGVMHELRKFYYDTAQGNHAGALAALHEDRAALAGALRHGFPVPRRRRGKRGPRRHGFSAADLRAINRDNALTAHAAAQSLSR